MILDKILEIPNIESLVNKGIYAEKINDIHVSTPFFFHPSSVGGTCLRKIQFDFLYSVIKKTLLDQVEEKNLFFVKSNPKLFRIFNNGTAAHELYGRYIKNSGVEIEIEKPIINYEYRYKGFIDGVINTKDKYILEFKTMNHFSFSKLKEPLISHIKQINIYQNEEKCDGIVVYINSNTQEIKEFFVKYNKKDIEETLNIINVIRTAIENNLFLSGDTQANCNSCKYDCICNSDRVIKERDYFTSDIFNMDNLHEQLRNEKIYKR